MVPMLGLSNNYQSYQCDLRVKDGTGLLIANSPLFDQTQKNIWVGLAYGGVLHLADDGFDPGPILRMIGTGEVQITNLAPSAFEVLTELDTDGVLPNLKVVLLGGEMLRPAACTALIGTDSRSSTTTARPRHRSPVPRTNWTSPPRTPSRGRSRSAPRSAVSGTTCSTAGCARAAGSDR